ncbi:MAG: hypothetical protein ACREOF_08960 [Gemmatimonadales bacterium]
MDPELSGFALGLLLGAAKVGLIGTVAFGIAWWRARRRLRALEAEQTRPALTDERLEHLEQGIDYLASRLDRLVEGQSDGRQLSAGAARRADPITPH